MGRKPLEDTRLNFITKILAYWDSYHRQIEELLVDLQENGKKIRQIKPDKELTMPPDALKFIQDCIPFKFTERKRLEDFLKTASNSKLQEMSDRIYSVCEGAYITILRNAIQQQKLLIQNPFSRGYFEYF